MRPHLRHLLGQKCCVRCHAPLFKMMHLRNSRRCRRRERHETPHNITLPHRQSHRHPTLSQIIYLQHLPSHLMMHIISNLIILSIPNAVLHRRRVRLRRKRPRKRNNGCSCCSIDAAASMVIKSQDQGGGEVVISLVDGIDSVISGR